MTSDNPLLLLDFGVINTKIWVVNCRRLPFSYQVFITASQVCKNSVICIITMSFLCVFLISKTDSQFLCCTCPQNNFHLLYTAQRHLMVTTPQ